MDEQHRDTQKRQLLHDDESDQKRQRKRKDTRAMRRSREMKRDEERPVDVDDVDEKRYSDYSKSSRSRQTSARDSSVSPVEAVLSKRSNQLPWVENVDDDETLVLHGRHQLDEMLNPLAPLQISVQVDFTHDEDEQNENDEEEGLVFNLAIPQSTLPPGESIDHLPPNTLDNGDADGESDREFRKKRKKNKRRRLYSGSIGSGGWRGRAVSGRWGGLVPPENVHTNDWRDMITLADASPNTAGSGNRGVHQESLPRKPTSEGEAQHTVPAGGLAAIQHWRWSGSDLSLQRQHWITETFLRRECAKFLPTNKDPGKCGCGRLQSDHYDLAHLTSTFLSCPTDYTDKGILREEDEEESIEKTPKETPKVEQKSQPVSRKQGRGTGERWSIKKHTMCLPTNAFGQIEFQGAAHPYRAQYVRLSFDTDPANIMGLFEQVWGIQPPKLIITVHGGVSNFDLQQKLARVFRKGLLKAAKTTGAWIITSGVDCGVVRQVAAALEGSGSSSRSKIVTIGITSWGLLKKREDLLGKDIVVPYHPHSFHARSRTAVLNNRHSYFLLVDNGTVGRYGADVVLRRRLEMYIAQKQKIFGGTRSVPVVSVVLEGGACTIRTVLDYVTNVPRVPVVICDGSGRASDLLAFAHQHVLEDGSFAEHVRLQLLSLIQRTFAFDERSAEKVLRELSICAQQKDLITVFRLGEKVGKHDVDYAILTALLKGQNLSGPDQLALALAWNRVDIAKSDIFGVEQQHAWSQAALHNAMMEALIHDRVDFVRLLIENGVSMHKFLNIGRLEELYNTDKGPPNTLYYIVRDVVKMRSGYHFKLPHIGMAIEKLMGNAYRSNYTSHEFRQKYNAFLKKFRTRRRPVPATKTRAGSGGMSRQATEPVLQIPKMQSHITGRLMPVTMASAEQQLSENMMSALSGSRALSNHILWRSAFRNLNSMTMRPPNLNENKEQIVDDDDMSTSGFASDHRGMSEFEFRYPFSELLLWAVLTKRQEMALCMWEHGEEALAKALVACRLYKSLAKEAAEDYLEVEICEELRKYAEEFRMMSLELLDHVYTQDDAVALQLLTYELKQWGNETCLSLAVIVNNKHFLAHPCCQILLADLWHGGLRIRSHSNAKVLVGLLLPFTIPALEFKTREELLLQPQTAAEHEQDINDTSSSSSSSSSDESSTTSFSDSDDDVDNLGAGRRTSHSSMQSLNTLNTIGLSSFFHRSRKRANRVKEKASEDNAVATIEAGLHKSTGASSTASPQMRKRQPKWPNQNGTLANGYGSAPDVRRRKNSLSSEDGDFPAKHNFRNLIPSNLQRMKKIKFRRRFYEFYAAPITTFWSWAIAFCLFLMCFTYVLLIKTPVHPSLWEWLLFAYVVCFGMEHTRKFMMTDMAPFSQKLKYFFFNYWNTVTALAIVCFFVGFGLRVFGILNWGRVILACDSVLWIMKLLDYMSVHPRLGPYITMAGKMVLSMSYIIVMLCVALLAFGLARQSITYPNEEWHPLLLRNIFLKPYFMLYGEVYADEIDQCGDDAWDQHLEEGKPLRFYTSNHTTNPNCVAGHWIPPILMTFFLLVANILLMSMLIAIFNHIFDQTEEFSQQIWLFQRYRQVMEYESTPFFPPPLTFIWHIYMLIKYIRWRCRKRNPNDERALDVFDFSLKLFLSEDQVEKLHDFEEDCMEELGRKKEHERNTSSEQRILRTAERTDLMMARLNDLTSKESMLRGDLQGMENRLELIETRQVEILDAVRQLTQTLPFFLQMQTGAIRTNLSPAPSIILQGPREQSIEEPSHSAPCFGQITSQQSLTDAPTRPRQRTSTICGPDAIQDPILLSPSGNNLDPLRVGSLTNLAGPTQAILAHSGSIVLPRRDTISMSFRRRHHEEYTTITDAISLAAADGRSVERRDTDDETIGGLLSDEEPNSIVLPKKKSKVSSVLPPAVDEAVVREEEAMADCELTEVEKDEEVERLRGNGDLSNTRSSDDGEGLTFIVNSSSLNRLHQSTPTPPEPHPSPELARSRGSTPARSIFRHHTID
ncbi:unnamed protein product, partial [Mesorhabditis belari]|uniref:Uncharacterized protein n=1 Tax=Mesorhabditis belari TaxID=2138241 RepID=A0AAF3EDK4_9BILA